MNFNETREAGAETGSEGNATAAGRHRRAEIFLCAPRKRFLRAGAERAWCAGVRGDGSTVSVNASAVCDFYVVRPDSPIVFDVEPREGLLAH